jgi:hypothetical protein
MLTQERRLYLITLAFVRFQEVDMPALERLAYTIRQGGVLLCTLLHARSRGIYLLFPGDEEAMLLACREQITPALQVAECVCAGQPCADERVRPTFLTGLFGPGGYVDACIADGHDVVVAFEHDHARFVAEISGREHVVVPAEIRSRITATGQRVVWQHRGFIYDIAPGELPGAIHMTCRNPAKTAHMWYDVLRTGFGASIWEAMESAVHAPKFELTEA